MSRPESSRNQYIYPEKQTPTDRLASRLQTSLSEYLNPEISDDEYDGVALTIKGIARRFIEEVKVDMTVTGGVTPRRRKKKVNGNMNVDDDAIYGVNVQVLPRGVVM